MDGKTTIKYLQNYIKQKDYHPELLKDYFLKLAEEVGELSRAMRKDIKAESLEQIKGTIDEELLKRPGGAAFSEGGYLPSRIAMASLLDILQKVYGGM